jgi:hypothetical protein
VPCRFQRSLGGLGRPGSRGIVVVAAVAVYILLTFAVTGCGRPEAIEVDLSSMPVRFVIDHSGWPRPFWWPRVTEFAMGSEEDDLLWQLEATDSRGELAHKLAFVYGEVPPGFAQVFPAVGRCPRPLTPGRSYYVGAAGPKAVYRSVFALPISSDEAARLRSANPPVPEADVPQPGPVTTGPSRIAPIPKPGTP